MIALTGCDEEEGPKPATDLSDGSVAPADGGASSSNSDGGVSAPPADAGSVRPDAGTVRPDAGTVSPDAGVDPGVDPIVDGGSTATPTASRFWLPTPEPTNTALPRVEIDSSGGIHSVYPAYVRGGAFYSYCQGDCSSSEQVKVVAFETEGTVDNALLTLTPAGQPRLLLSTYQHLYWAQCDQGCTEETNWTQVEILNHGGERAVTGEALTLDEQGRPRFVFHTRRTLFGIGQKPPKTLLAKCDGACENPASWVFDEIDPEKIWEGSSLRYDATGRAHVATYVFDFGETPDPDVGAYLTCLGACNGGSDWNGIGFFAPYESMTEAVSMHPTISLELTKAGKPRLAQLGKNAEGKKVLGYFECDADDCTGDSWKLGFSWIADPLHEGLDLALDQNDRPRFAHTINYNIVMTYCDDADCTKQGAGWDSVFIESGDDLPADDIFLEWNCTIGAWFLHSPSLALTPDGKPRVAYQARDISGGVSNPDPLKPGCVAGTDMTWTRMAVLPTAH